MLADTITTIARPQRKNAADMPVAEQMAPHVGGVRQVRRRPDEICGEIMKAIEVRRSSIGRGTIGIHPLRDAAVRFGWHRTLSVIDGSPEGVVRLELQPVVKASSELHLKGVIRRMPVG